ncbi:MAG: hypothetical protein OSB15_09465 [Amylibacter sp.]|nr:hypothetical protein [Amylibacter sp.]
MLKKFKGLFIALVLIAPLANSNGAPNEGACNDGWHNGFFGCHKPHGNPGEPSWLNAIGNYLDSASCFNNPGPFCRTRISGALCPENSVADTPDRNGFCFSY